MRKALSFDNPQGLLYPERHGNEVPETTKKNHDAERARSMKSTWTVFTALLALGGFSQVAGWLLITNALPKMRASLSGLILLLQPALAFVWDVLLFQRPTTALNWTGVGLALAAIYLGLTAGSKKIAARSHQLRGQTRQREN